MLEVQSLTHSYGTTPALRGASFSARPGEILGYLGPNGRPHGSCPRSRSSRSA